MNVLPGFGPLCCLMVLKTVQVVAQVAPLWRGRLPCSVCRAASAMWRAQGMRPSAVRGGMWNAMWWGALPAGWGVGCDAFAGE